MPTLLLVGGVVLGIGLALLCRLLVALTARSRARRAEKRLRVGVVEVADDLVVGPLQAELDAHRRAVEGLRAARR